MENQVQIIDLVTMMPRLQAAVALDAFRAFYETGGSRKALDGIAHAHRQTIILALRAVRQC